MSASCQRPQAARARTCYSSFLIDTRRRLHAYICSCDTLVYVIITSARRYCDPSCLLVGWYVRLFGNILPPPTSCTGCRWAREDERAINIALAVAFRRLAEIAPHERFFLGHSRRACFFKFLPPDLRAPLADRRETLPHMIGNWLNFIMQVQKFGVAHQKIGR